MSNSEAQSEQVRQHRQIKNRLQTAATRLDDAQIERTAAIISAHEQGFSVRQIAAVTGLSSTRVHQLLTAPDAHDIPQWLSYLREADEPTRPPGEIAQQPQESQSNLMIQPSAEVTALRQCIGWLEQLEQGKPVVVNLRLESDPQTEYMRFDGERIQRILSRIAADLEELARRWGGREEAPSSLSQPEEAEEVRHRRRLAEPPAQARRLSPYEERNALRAEAGLPPK